MNAAELLTENDLLKNELEQRDQSIKEKNKLIEKRDALISVLEEKLRLADIARFAAKSEKVSPDQLGIFDEADSQEPVEQEGNTSETTTVKSYQRSTKPRVSIPENLPREEIIYDLPEAEKVCPHDGTALECIGSDDHEQLDIIPAQVKALRHKRLKYACPCCKEHLATASKPKQPIEKSIASSGLLAYVAIQKYADALPLYRQSEIFKRAGVALDRTNLANWMIKCGQLVQPLINLIQEHIQQQPVIHLDETRVQVLKEPDRKAQNQSYMWIMGSFKEQRAVIFHYSPTRNQTVPLTLLSSSTQAIMVDGYEGYENACQTYQIDRLGCWAHARRKFVDAQKAQSKGKTGKPDMALSFIQKLYALERKINDLPPDKRLEIRQQQAKPTVDKFKIWLDKHLLTTNPQSSLGKALSYTCNQLRRLTCYLNNWEYPLDNNPAENAIRPFVVGRKNWLFSNSQAGANASANLYSLIETAKLNQLNPHTYLQQILQQLPQAESLEDIEKLLPWNIQNS